MLEFLESMKATRTLRKERQRGAAKGASSGAPSSSTSSAGDDAASAAAAAVVPAPPATSADSVQSLSPLAAEALLQDRQLHEPHHGHHHHRGVGAAASHRPSPFHALPAVALADAPAAFAAQPLPLPAAAELLVRLRECAERLSGTSASADPTTLPSSALSAEVVRALVEAGGFADAFCEPPAAVAAMPVSGIVAAEGDVQLPPSEVEQGPGGPQAAHPAATDVEEEEQGGARGSDGQDNGGEGGAEPPLLSREDPPPGDFLGRLKHPAAADVIELLRSFLKNFGELDIPAIYDATPDPDAYDDIEEEEEEVAAEEEAAAAAAAAARDVDEGKVEQQAGGDSADPGGETPRRGPGSRSESVASSLPSTHDSQTGASGDWSAVLKPVYSADLVGLSGASALGGATDAVATPHGKGGAPAPDAAPASSAKQAATVAAAAATTASKSSSSASARTSGGSATPSRGSSSSSGGGGGGGRGRGAGRAGGPAARRPATPSVGASPGDRVRAFLTRVEETLRSHPLWRHDGPQEWEATSDELEKFVLCKIHAAVFAAHPACGRRDRLLSRRLQSLSFVTFRHMDLPEPSPFLLPGWRLAQAALRDIDRYTSPADKLACILNTCRIVSTMLTAAADERGKGDKGVGADEFLPALIYTVIHACPPRLYSSLRYIGDFRNPSRLMSEQGYFYTNVLSAVAFAKRVRADMLSMTHAEFEAAVRAARARAESQRAADVERAVGTTATARRLGKFRRGDGPAGVAEGDFAAELEIEKRLLALRISPSALSFAGLNAAAVVEGAEAFSSGRPSDASEGEGVGGEGEGEGEGTAPQQHLLPSDGPLPVSSEESRRSETHEGDGGSEKEVEAGGSGGSSAASLLPSPAEDGGSGSGGHPLHGHTFATRLDYAVARVRHGILQQLPDVAAHDGASEGRSAPSPHLPPSLVALAAARERLDAALAGLADGQQATVDALASAGRASEAVRRALDGRGKEVTA